MASVLVLTGPFLADLEACAGLACSIFSSFLSTATAPNSDEDDNEGNDAASCGGGGSGDDGAWCAEDERTWCRDDAHFENRFLALTREITPLVGFSDGVDVTAAVVAVVGTVVDFFTVEGPSLFLLSFCCCLFCALV